VVEGVIQGGVGDEMGEDSDIARRLSALEDKIDELLAWKTERDKPIVVEFGNAFACESPLERKRKAQDLIGTKSSEAK